MKTFHTTSWPAYICAWAPANVFVCCSSTPSVVAVCPRVQKSVGSWVDGHDCQWTRLLPGAGLSARDIRQNSVAGHIFLCFLREARQVVPLGFSICIFSQMSFPLLYFSVSLLIQPFLSPLGASFKTLEIQLLNFDSQFRIKEQQQQNITFFCPTCVPF